MNEGLKKFAHVNKKAFEQYNNFTKQRDQLLKRRDDLEKSGESIEQLVEVLDQRKDEAIERTFKQVAKNFEEVFETLVPAGKGKLVIQRRVDQESTFRLGLMVLLKPRARMMMKLTRLRTPSNAPSTTTLGWQSRCVLTTVLRCVSKRPCREGFFQLQSRRRPTYSATFWRSKVTGCLGTWRVFALIATFHYLTLFSVFAIQKCDPAPFYLFDEVRRCRACC